MGKVQCRQHKPSRPAREPHVGIFWRLKEKLIFDMTPLSAAEVHLHFKFHSGDHVSVWERFRQQRIVPPEIEYEEPPRGRVVYSVIDGKFTLLADKCILRDRVAVRKIMAEMNLPRGTETSTDQHYRCSACLYGNEDEGED